MSVQEFMTALEHLKSGGFQPGAEMESAHEVCQQHEGTPLYDWLHALVHRIEGDDANAAYWYRRSGKKRHPGSVEDEWRAIRQAVVDS